MKGIKVNYPENFYSFGSGVKISDEEINKWIREGIDYLEEHQDESSYRIASGDTMIVIFRFLYNSSNENTYSYEVNVCKNRQELMVDLENNKESKTLINLDDFHIGNKIKFIKRVGEDYCSIPLNSNGIVININKNSKYPIRCTMHFHNGYSDNYNFLPQELEVIE